MKLTIGLIVLLICSCISCDRKENSIKSNAEIISFNSEKCMCCWGWTIKYGNDTIKSNDAIIGKIVGYEIDKPIPVYVELGVIWEACSKNRSGNPDCARDYYAIKKIEKIEN